MRSPTRWTALLLGIGATLAITGCSQVQEATDTVNSAADTVNNAAATAEVCQDALSLVASPPDLSSPQAALEQTQEKASELTDLAATTTDADIRRAINDLAETLNTTDLDTLANDSTAWLTTRTEQVTALTTACTP